ncbi:MAG: hypothetical protein QOG75_5662 [Mycobacterium sp.]|nr:hypothetical protein [Mycobacterium sp.]
MTASSASWRRSMRTSASARCTARSRCSCSIPRANCFCSSARRASACGRAAGPTPAARIRAAGRPWTTPSTAACTRNSVSVQSWNSCSSSPTGRSTTRKGPSMSCAGCSPGPAPSDRARTSTRSRPGATSPRERCAARSHAHPRRSRRGSSSHGRASCVSVVLPLAKAPAP